MDGPWSVGDAFGVALATALTIGIVGYGVYQATKVFSLSIPKSEEAEKDITVLPSHSIVIL